MICPTAERVAGGATGAGSVSATFVGRFDGESAVHHSGSCPRTRWPPRGRLLGGVPAADSLRDHERDAAGMANFEWPEL